MDVQLVDNHIEINLNGCKRQFYIGDISVVLTLMFGSKYQDNEDYIRLHKISHRMCEPTYCKLPWKILKYLLLKDSKETNLKKHHVLKLYHKLDVNYLHDIIRKNTEKQ